MSATGLGPFCDVVGVNSDNLGTRLSQLAPKQLTNGVVYEIDQHIRHTRHLQMTDLLDSFEAVFQQNCTRITADIAGNFVLNACRIYI